MNDAGLTLLKQFEGFRGDPYKDAGGVLTVGYGTTFPLDEVEASMLLGSRVGIMEAAVRELVTVPLSENQWAALTSLVYNIGQTAFRDSTLLERINAQDWTAVPTEWRRWVKAGKKTLPGLVARREDELKLWFA